MKNILTVTLLFTFALALAITACKDEPPAEVQREFTITGFAKDIKVIDTRTGSDDIDLEKLGVISKLTTGLTSAKGYGSSRFDPVINRGITIVIENVTDYDGEYSKVYSGNKMGISFSYISGVAEYLADVLEDSIFFMYDNNMLTP